MVSDILAQLDRSRDEIERRKQLIRDLWAGRPVDHLPVLVHVGNPDEPSTVREQFTDADTQLRAAMRNVALTWELVPEGDWVPAMRPDVGCSCLATAYGAELFWGEDPNQTCGIREPLLGDPSEAFDLPVPAPDAGQLREGIERVRLFAEAGQGLVHVSLLDMAGGPNVAADLLGCTNLYMAMLDKPDAVACLIDNIQQLFLATIEEQIDAAGGQDNITTTDFPDYWFPEGCKGHVSDDISANVSPDMYERFSLPAHNRVFQKYGGGGLHNCGPNPCLAGYLSHNPPPRAIDLSWNYSRDDLPAIKTLCRHRALIYMGEFPAEPATAIETYRQVMEQMAPDVAVIPALSVSAQADPAGLYRELKTIATEYATRMDFGWEDVSADQDPTPTQGEHP